MPDIIPTRAASHPAPLTPTARVTQRGLERLELRTTMRMAGVQGEGMVQTEKLREVDALTREAMTGHAMLRRWSDALAGGDPFLADELKFFTDTARLGKGEIIADTIDAFCRESRR
jgi:hypothetical protein